MFMGIPMMMHSDTPESNQKEIRELLAPVGCQDRATARSQKLGFKSQPTTHQLVEPGLATLLIYDRGSCEAQAGTCSQLVEILTLRGRAVPAHSQLPAGD